MDTELLKRADAFLRNNEAGEVMNEQDIALVRDLAAALRAKPGEQPDIDHVLFLEAATCLAVAAPKGQFSEVVAHLRAIGNGLPEGAVSVLKAAPQGQATEETGNDRPAAPLSSQQPAAPKGEHPEVSEALRAIAEEIRSEGHNGWGNGIADIADALEAQEGYVMVPSEQTPSAGDEPVKRCRHGIVLGYCTDCRSATQPPRSAP